AESLLEGIRDAGRQRRPRAQETGATVLERLDRRDAHERSEQRWRPGEEIDLLLAQELGDSLGRDLILEEKRRARRQRGQQAEVEAVAPVQGERAEDAIGRRDLERLADSLRGRLQVGGGLEHPLGIPADAGRQLHHLGGPRTVGQTSRRAALVEPTGEQRPLQPAPRFRDELRRRPGRRARGHRTRIVGEPGGRLAAFAAARAGDERAQRRRLEHHLELAVPGGRIERHDDGVDLRQRQRQDDEVGDVSQHEADPGARRDPQRVQLLGAPVDAVEQPPPGEIGVTIDQCLPTALVRGDARKPFVKLHAARGAFRKAPASLYADGDRPQGPHRRGRTRGASPRDYRVGAKAASPTEPHRGRFGTLPGFRDYRVGAKAASPTEPHRGRFGALPGFRDYRVGAKAASPTEPHRGRFGALPGFRDYRVGAKAASPTEPPRGRFGTPPGFRDYRVGAKAASPTEPPRGRFGTPPGFRDYRVGAKAASPTEPPRGRFGTPPGFRDYRVGAKAASPTEPPRGRFGTPPGFRDYRVGAKAASPTEPPRGRFGTLPGFRDYRAATRWVPERSVFSFRYSLTMWRPT